MRTPVTGLPHEPDCGWPHSTLENLRSIFVHTIEEYARHNGHANLLRERLDGAAAHGRVRAIPAVMRAGLRLPDRDGWVHHSSHARLISRTVSSPRCRWRGQGEQRQSCR